MIYLKLFYEFFKIGLFTIGGGYAMIPLVKETVIANSWIEEATFYDFIGICESTPGPIAINMATYVGSIQGGILGSVVATLGVILPSFIIILLIASILSHFTENKIFKRIINGIKPVVISLILSTGLILAFKAIGYESIESFNLNVKALIILLVLVCIYYFVKIVWKKKINTILLIVISAILGILIYLV